MVRKMDCPNCGAPLKFIEGQDVLTCEFCSTSSKVDRFKKKITISKSKKLYAKRGGDRSDQNKPETGDQPKALPKKIKKPSEKQNQKQIQKQRQRKSFSGKNVVWTFLAWALGILIISYVCEVLFRHPDQLYAILKKIFNF